MSQPLNRARNLTTLLFQILIFLIPTQLGLHLWPAWSHVFGIRVDYLALTIYLTDIFIFLIILFWLGDCVFQNSITKLFKIIKKKSAYILPLFVLAVLNTLFSQNWQVSLLKWIKIFEFSLFILFIYNFKGEIRKLIKKPLALSLLFFSLIGITQFILQKTLGGPFYLFGERSFSLQTPGIALAEFLGKQVMRAYSTFSHPNSLAGYLLVVLILLGRKKEGLIKLILAFGLLAFVLTFSQGAFFALLVIFLLTTFIESTQVKLRTGVLFIFSSLLIISLILPVVSESLLDAREYGEGIEKRLVLATSAGDLFSKRPLVGVGLNNFVTKLPELDYDKEIVWTLQPVHNIFLLVLSETGVVGIFIFSLFLFKTLTIVLKSKKDDLTLSLVAILLTGFLDHYWLTLQQNQLLFSLVIGLSVRKKSKS